MSPEQKGSRNIERLLKWILENYLLFSSIAILFKGEEKVFRNGPAGLPKELEPKK